ncbi:BTB/POZ domain-containing protein [Ditylenchus destructor]|nr:BTB/POZ domain-containing protein [Ditylenchus destructor]
MADHCLGNLEKVKSKNKWVRLNVGGKTFQTTKDTLSRYPDSFLARLVNGELSSDKDESGAYLVDGNPEHFDTILTYLRRGVLNLDGNEKTAKDLLLEADFYNIQSLVEEIRKAMRTGTNRTEVVTICVTYDYGKRRSTTIFFSETQDDYEVLQALHDRIQLNFEPVTDGQYKSFYLTMEEQISIETTLRQFGFVQDSYEDKYDEDSIQYKLSMNVKCWKFVRTISK